MSCFQSFPLSQPVSWTHHSAYNSSLFHFPPGEHYVSVISAVYLLASVKYNHSIECLILFSVFVIPILSSNADSPCILQVPSRVVGLHWSHSISHVFSEWRYHWSIQQDRVYFYNYWIVYFLSMHLHLCSILLICVIFLLFLFFFK